MNYARLKSLIAEDIKIHGKPPTFMVFVKRYLRHPGFVRIIFMRIAQWLHPKGWFCRQIAHRIHVTAIERGCHLSPKACVEGGLRIPHPIGIVIGDGTRIGKNAVIFQNVTIGMRNETDVGYPELGDNVRLYAGCCVVGPIKIGDNVIVGANAVVTKDVPANHYALGNPAIYKPIK